MINRTFQELTIKVDFEAELTQKMTSNGQQETMQLAVSWDSANIVKELNPSIMITWYIDLIECHYMWTPTTGSGQGLAGEWIATTKQMLSQSMPIATFFNAQELSQYTCVLSDAKNELETLFCVKEETGQLACTVKIPITQFSQENYYELMILNDFEQKNYATKIKESVNWLVETNHLVLLEAPESAFEPVYSTWYSYHQQFSADELEAEGRLARNYGLSTFILDDGWQTGDNNRGYGYCGDWQLEKSKIANMPIHINRMKELGFSNYLIWYSVPYIGIHSTHWLTFKDKLLYFDEAAEAGILDPRYPEVRAYLIGTYLETVAKWGLTGLKLDFIDLFYHRELAQYNPQMSPSSLQDAVDLLLKELVSQLMAQQPAFLLEFRQSYIGPFIQQYGNIFRVSDCPNSLLQNRLGVINLRLICQKAAVHSDMLMWHPADTVESACLQVLNVITGTVQLSVRLAEQDGVKEKMLHFWLDFMQKHRTLLQRSHFQPHCPQENYSWVETWTEDEHFIATYSSNKVISLKKPLKKQTWLVNGSYGKGLVLEVCEQELVELQIFDCQGNLLVKENRQLEVGVTQLNVPPCGLISLAKGVAVINEYN